MAGKKRPANNAKSSQRTAKRSKSSSKPSASIPRPKDQEKKPKKDGFQPIPAVQGTDINSSDAEDAAMMVDSDFDDNAEFLTRLDEKGMATSRPTLLKEYRKEKPKATRENKLSHIPVLSTGPTKSEIKAQKKLENKMKKLEKRKLKAGADSDDVSEEEGIGKSHPDGELLDDLESDDFAFGSGAEDDDLSVMSEFESMSEMSNMSDLDSDLGSFNSEDFDSEDFDNLDSDNDLLDDKENEEPEAWGGIGPQGSDATTATLMATDSDDEHQSKRTRKSAEESDDLESKYLQQTKKIKESKSKPTKLPTIENGQVLRASTPLRDGEFSASPSASPEPEEKPKKQVEYKSDPLGQRFGRPAVRQLLEIRNKQERISRAREEIADLGREASGTGEGEGGLNLLRRLLSLTAPKFAPTTAAKNAGAKSIKIDPEIRVLAMLSLLAVFVDIIPGYRIRPLTSAEKETKVSQAILRQREWEQGLVVVYQQFLRNCEGDISENTDLAPAALHCLCQLITEKPDFNFANNIIDVVVKRLGRKGWDEGHQSALTAVIHLFVNDSSTDASISLHVVRRIAHLVKARAFAVRPEVIAALLNLRLKEELGGGRIRASTDAVYRENVGKGKNMWNQVKIRKGKKGGKAKSAMDKAGSKKARAAAKEQAEIEKEIKEAEGQIDQEDRERNQTETLKLLFSLYFKILKLEYRSPLLPVALEGLARFAHLINVDFFRDLLEVLKGLIGRGDVPEDEELEEGHSRRNDNRERLLCIVTAFELLQGQGESLNIDLGDFVAALYRVLLPIAFSPTIEETPYTGQNEMNKANKATSKIAQTEIDLIFRALVAIFLAPRTLPPPTRTMSFSKRLLSCSLNWPSESQIRVLGFLRSLLMKEPRLEGMLDTTDRKANGKWKGDVEDPDRAEPEGTCWWEVFVLLKHPDERVRVEAKKLLNYNNEE